MHFSCDFKTNIAAICKAIGAVEGGAGKIGVLSADLAKKTSVKAGKNTKLGETKEKKEQLSIVVKDTEVRCEKEATCHTSSCRCRLHEGDLFN